MCITKNHWTDKLKEAKRLDQERIEQELKEEDGRSNMLDPTYNSEVINADPIWALAFLLSEMLNNSAPIGWSKYIWIAETLLAQYEMTLKGS